MEKVKKLKYTEADLKLFKKTFMKAVSKLGLSEWVFEFCRTGPDMEDCTAAVSADMSQKRMYVYFAKEYNKTGTRKNDDILDAAEHEAIEAMLYPIRMLAADEKGREIWERADAECHTIINRIQHSLFPKGWDK